MKQDKKERDVVFDSQSILNTNSAKMEASIPEETETEIRASRKQRIVSLIVVLGVVLAVVAVFVLGGIVSENQAKKKQEEEAEAARIAALKEVRADTVYITSEEPELLPYRVTWSAINACYSNENGMYITMNFANGHDTAVPVKEINVWLKRGEELVASGRLRNIVDLVIPAAGDVDYTFYLDPSLVKITDLEEDVDLVWEFEITTDVDAESQALAKEKREDSLVITGEKPQVQPGAVTYAVTEAYYTNDNSICMTLVFANGKDTPIQMKEVNVKLYNLVSDEEGGLLVTEGALSIAQSADIPAGGMVTYTHYFDADTVVITELTEDDRLNWVVEYKAE